MGYAFKIEKKVKKFKKIFCESNAKTHVRTVYRGMRSDLKKAEITLTEVIL